MADEDIREAERNATMGGPDEAKALKILQLRVDPLKPVEFRRTLNESFCAKCGEKASHVFMNALVGLSWIRHSSYDQESWRRTVDGETPNFVDPGWNHTKAGEVDMFKVSETRLRAEDNSEMDVTVVCKNSHQWNTILVSVWLEPLPEEEAEARGEGEI